MAQVYFYRGAGLGNSVIDHQAKPRSLHAFSEASTYGPCISSHVTCDALGDSTVDNGYRSPHVFIGGKSKKRLYQG